MKTEKVPPGASRLIDSLTDLGYDYHTAIADLIDNSIVAKASNVWVDVFYETKQSTCMIVADDGIGMDRSRLLDAMRFGSHKEYKKSELGKYGLGLKTASLSQCNELTVITKQKPKKGKRSRLFIARWDLHHVNRRNEWELFILEKKELKTWEQGLVEEYIEVRDFGTLIIWKDMEQKMPLLYSAVEKKKFNYSTTILKDIQEHSSVTFHKFLQGQVTGRKKLNIHVGGAEISAWDPFCINEKKTTCLDPKSYSVDYEGKRYEVVASPYLLPRKEDYSSIELETMAAGTKGMNRSQGLYFYRNGRLLKHGGWSGMRINDEHTKLARVSVDFPPELDKLFSVNITKMTARIPATIKKTLQKDSAEWVSKGRKKYDHRSKKNSRGPGGSKETKRLSSNPGKNGSTWTLTKSSGSVREKKIGRFSLTITPHKKKDVSIIKDSKGKLTKIMIPSQSELADLFRTTSHRNAELSNLCLVLYGYLEGLSNKKIKLKDIPVADLKKLLKGLR